MKEIEIKDIAMWEETDSELAKYSIQSLSSLIRNQVNQLKANDLMIGELINRIDKAIEYIETSKNAPQPFYKYIFADENGDVQNLDKLLDILRGDNNE